MSSDLATLNSATKNLSNDLLPEGVKTVSLHSGWVKTSVGASNALIEADESAQGLKYIIDNLQDAQSGGFYSYTGDEIPW